MAAIMRICAPHSVKQAIKEDDYRVSRWIGYFRFDLNLWVWSRFLGHVGGGWRRAVLDISEGLCESFWASRLLS